MNEEEPEKFYDKGLLGMGLVFFLHVFDWFVRPNNLMKNGNGFLNDKVVGRHGMREIGIGGFCVVFRVVYLFLRNFECKNIGNQLETLLKQEIVFK